MLSAQRRSNGSCRVLPHYQLTARQHATSAFGWFCAVLRRLVAGRRCKLPQPCNIALMPLCLQAMSQKSTDSVSSVDPVCPAQPHSLLLTNLKASRRGERIDTSCDGVQRSPQVGAQRRWRQAAACGPICASRRPAVAALPPFPRHQRRLGKTRVSPPRHSCQHAMWQRHGLALVARVRQGAGARPTSITGGLLSQRFHPEVYL
eukprot:360121-Chlamydomonas_euryale.AAC.19